MKDVTHTPLFECMMTGEIDGHPYDLHNDYQCIKIQLNGAEKKLQLRFINDDYKIIVEFHQVTVTSFAISPEKAGKAGILGQFYRGRFKFNNNLHEISSSGKYYYYLALLENDTIELLAKRVTMAISRLNS